MFIAAHTKVYIRNMVSSLIKQNLPSLYRKCKAVMHLAPKLYTVYYNIAYTVYIIVIDKR